MKIKIDRDIPLPPRNNGSGRIMSEETKMALSMKPGDSIFCPTATLYRRIVHAMRSRKLSYTTRKVEDGYRIWRVDGRKLQKAANA